MENDETLSHLPDKQRKKDELTELYPRRTDRIHTVKQLLKAYSLYEKDVEYVIQKR